MPQQNNNYADRRREGRPAAQNGSGQRPRTQGSPVGRPAVQNKSPNTFQKRGAGQSQPASYQRNGQPPRNPNAGSRPSAPRKAEYSKPRVPKNGNPKKRSFIKSGVNQPTRDTAGGSAVSSLIKAIIYIMSILVVSGFISYFAISVGNDVFAFVKSENEITVTIEDGTDIAELGVVLQDNGVIKYSKIFDIYATLRNKTPVLQAGSYTVTPSMSYDSLIATFAKQIAPERTTVVVTIPEGYTVDQTIELIVTKYGLSSKDALVEAIQNYDFDYWFVQRLKTDKLRAGRKYRLEGYLYPDTYYYYSDASAETILYKMLDNFDKKMKAIFKNDTSVPGDDYIEKIDYLCKKHNLTFDDAVTLASMLQMEAKYDIEYGTISSVFHNRLNNPSVTNGKLESDATLQYMLEKRTENLTDEHKMIDSPYNTYMYAGLPPGAIASFSQTALIYALYPEDTKYYFFVAGSDGYSLFAKTYKEHQANIEKVKAEQEE